MDKAAVVTCRLTWNHPSPELAARRTASKTDLVELETLAADGWAGDDTPQDLRLHYEERKGATRPEPGKIEDDGYEDRSRAHQRVRLRLYAAELQTILPLRNSGAISNDVMHRLERKLDLEESQLEG